MNRSRATMEEVVVSTPIGRIFALRGDLGIVALEFDEGWHERLEQVRRARGAPRLLRARGGEVEDRLRAYFGGHPTAIDELPIDPTGTAWQREVWAALRRIPAGSVESYGRLASTLGRQGAARAVGRAAATNPIAIVVPCHRLVGRAGALTGYAYGLARKQWLLQHEGAIQGMTFAHGRSA